MASRKNLYNKMFKMICADRTKSSFMLRCFLRGYDIVIDPRYYERIEELKEQMTKVINIDPATIPPTVTKDPETGEEKTKPFENEGGTFSTDTELCASNAGSYIFWYIMSDIEETWRKFGVSDVYKSVARSKWIIRPQRAAVKLELQEHLDKTFIELEKFIGNLEATANGHPEGLYHNDESIMDLNQRDVTFKPVKDEDAATDENSEKLATEESGAEGTPIENPTAEEEHSDECECPICKSYNYEFNEETKEAIRELRDHEDDPEWCKENLYQFDNVDDALKSLGLDPTEPTEEECPICKEADYTSQQSPEEIAEEIAESQDIKDRPENHKFYSSADEMLEDITSRLNEFAEKDVELTEEELKEVEEEAAKAEAEGTATEGEESATEGDMNEEELLKGLQALFGGGMMGRPSQTGKPKDKKKAKKMNKLKRQQRKMNSQRNRKK